MVQAEPGGTINLRADSSIGTGYLRAYGGGGGGSGGRWQGDAGGDGGAGGTVQVSGNSTISVGGDINVSGGGGGGGNFWTNGAGGAGGTIAITGGGAVVVDGSMLAGGGGSGGSGVGWMNGGGSLGGGGGGGGSQSLYGAGGGGLYSGGSGGYYAGGGQDVYDSQCWGGAGGGIGGGGSGGSNGFDGSPGQGGGGAVFGMGVAGGNAGSAANGGVISITGDAVAVNKTIGSAFESLYTGSGANPFTTSPFAGYSVYAGSGGSITINSQQGTTVLMSTRYSSSGDFSSAAADFQVPAFGIGFPVGQPPLQGTGSAGALNGGAITFNGVAQTLTDLAGGLMVGGNNVRAAVTITFENGTTRSITGGSSVTPAEWVAAIQSLLQTQTLVLNISGSAAGGTLSILPQNLPAGGFSTLVVPAGVAVTATVPDLPVNGSTTVNGRLAVSGNFTVFAQADGLTISNTGSIMSGGNMTFAADRGVTVVDTGTISAGTNGAGGLSIIANDGDLSISGLSAPGGFATTISTAGSTVLGSAKGNISFTNVKFATAGGDFVAMAAGNITDNGTPAVQTIDTSNMYDSTGQPLAGGRIIMVAGTSSFESSGNPVLCSNCPASDAGGNLALGGVSARANGNSMLLEAHGGNGSGGSITVSNLEASGAGGSQSGCCSPAFNGQSAGAITVQADSDIQTGYLRAYGGGGAGENGAGAGN